MNTENDNNEEVTEETPKEVIETIFSYIKDEQIKKFIEKGAKVLFLYMPNSSSSQFQEEQLDHLYELYGDKISIGKVDVLENQEYAISKNIRSFPTTLYFKEGEIILSETGVQRNIENAAMQIL